MFDYYLIEIMESRPALLSISRQELSACNCSSVGMQIFLIAITVPVFDVFYCVDIKEVVRFFLYSDQ
jgi:hypothetical protein